MDEWRTNTPDGRTLIAMRGKDAWIVRCGTAQAQSPLLDVALIEAIRADDDVVTHSSVDFGAWTRAEADRIQEEFEQRPYGDTQPGA